MDRIPRPPSKDDFAVTVPKIGTFMFAKRTMADEIQIQVEYSRLVQGVQPIEWLSLLATWMSALRVLTVSAPAGWDIDGMDPTDEDTYTELFTVHSALVTKEGSFRDAKRLASQKAGQVPVAEPAVLVPAEIQPSAE